MTDYNVTSGVTSSGVTLNSGDNEFVSSGGIATGTINNGGAEFILDGGSVTGTQVNSGGVENVSSGGAASATVVNNSGSQVVHGGGSATGTVVNSGGNADVNPDATGTGAVVSGGVLNVYGTASGTQVQAGIEYVHSGGTAAGTVVSGGSQNIDAGSTAFDTVVYSGTVSNQGTISSTTSGPAVTGEGAGATIQNFAGASINSADAGVWLNSGGSVSNAGLIAGATAAVAVHSAGSASIVNSSGGVLNGDTQGVFSDPGTTVTLTNGGTIRAQNTSGVGVELSGGTVTNFGTIEGGSGGLAISGVTHLTLEGTQVMSGIAQAASGHDGTMLELGAAAGAGTLSGLGTSYAGFQAVTVDAGADWTLSGANTISGSLFDDGTLSLTSGGSLTVTGAALADVEQQGTIDLGANTSLSLGLGGGGGLAISGFAGSDTITLTGLAYASTDTVSVSGDIVTVTDAGGATQSLTISGAQNDSFALSSATSGGVQLALAHPTITAVAAQPSVTGRPLGANSTISFLLTPSAAVTVAGGSPRLALSDGAIAAFDPEASTPTSLVFMTTVIPGQNTSDLTVTGFNPNGASITDANGLSLDASALATAPGSDTALVIDTTAPAAPAALALAPASDGGVLGDGLTDVARPAMTGTAEPGSTVTLTDASGGTPVVPGLPTVLGPPVVLPAIVLGTAVANSTTGQWTIVPAAPLSEGPHSLTATATDAAGNVSVASSPFTLTIDTTPPTIAITSTGGLTNQALQTVTGTDDTSEAGRTVTVLDGTQTVGTATVALDGTWSTSVTLTGDGAHSLTARQTDLAGNTGTSDAVAYTLDTTPPAVTASLADDTGPSSSDGITQDAALTGTGEANGVVTIRNGTTVLAAVTADAQGNWTYTPTLADGRYDLTASETDAAGNTGTATLGFTLDRVAPSVAVNAAAGPTNVVGQALSGALGAGEAGDSVTVRDGTTVVGTATADSSGNWRAPFTFTGNGTADTYDLTASATDLAGNAAQSTRFLLGLDFTPNQGLFGSVSHDVQSAAGQVDALYAGVLGRPADLTGQELWTADIAAGASVQDVAAGFLSSAEYTSRFGSYTASSDDAFVQQTYMTALGRAPDADGEAGWDNALANGTSRADVAAAIALSPESQAHLAGSFSQGVFVPDVAASEVARLYYGVLGRAPDGSGLAGFAQALKGGSLGLADVAQMMLSSPEGGARAAGSNQDYVTALYQGALGRAPDSAGLAGFTAQLAQGVSRASLAVTISESAEAIGNLSGRIEGGYHLS